MAKVKLKTVPTKASVAGFLRKVDKTRRGDCETIVALMQKATGAEPQMWGPTIVGFGRFRYDNGKGREGEWMMTGFSPRKNDLTLYVMPGVAAFPTLMTRLGKHKTGVSCLYIKKLEDVDLEVLRQLIETSVQRMADRRLDK